MLWRTDTGQLGEDSLCVWVLRGFRRFYVEKHFKREQLRQLEERAATVGAARIAEVEATEWPAAIAEVRTALARGVDLASAEAGGSLKARWA